MSRYLLILLAAGLLTRCASMEGTDGKSSPAPAVDPDAASGSRRSPLTSCGNGVCEQGETGQTCPGDCPAAGDATSDSSPAGKTGCTATNQKGCDGCACETCVCAMDAYCCQTEWDAQCASECANSCNGKCAGTCGNGTCDPGETLATCPVDCSATTGAGCTPSSKPGCPGCACESCVCAMDSYCCTTSWDTQCVAECAGNCGGTCTLGKCGDGNCDAGESHASCPQDCGELVQCIEKDCGGEWLACQMSAGCQDYTACRALCGTKTACAANCQAKVDAVDLALFATLEQCASAACLPEEVTCTQAQNKCNGNVLTFCNTQGQMVTLPCSDANCANEGFGPLIGCQKNQTGFDQCICQEAPPPACTTQQNKCNGNVLTWCDTTTGKLATTTCTDKLCQDAGFGSLDGCTKGTNGYDICACKPKP